MIKSIGGNTKVISKSSSRIVKYLGRGGGLNPGVYRLIAAHSGKCFDVSGKSRNTGAKIHQWDCHNGGNQKWRLSYNGREAVLINKLSNMAASIEGSSKNNEVDFVQMPFTNGANQKFRITFKKGGYELVNVNSGKCVDVFQQNKNNAARIIQVNNIIFN